MLSFFFFFFFQRDTFSDLFMSFDDKSIFNPIALRTAKTLSFGCSERNRV